MADKGYGEMWQVNRIGRNQIYGDVEEWKARKAGEK